MGGAASERAGRCAGDPWIVVTTINPPTRAIERIAGMCRRGWRAVVVGDLRTPDGWRAEGIDYLSVERQRQEFGELADVLPYRHYARKNLGYLHALREGASLILETDDDNIPYDSFGEALRPQVSGRLIRRAGWVNVYRQYSDATIWPRGLPLTAIHDPGDDAGRVEGASSPIQQYLADSDPDVDAIYRLVFPQNVTFARLGEAVVLEPHAWVPFNSQNTLFFPAAFPLLYLPCFVSFRMTDIWRSFVAQAALWIHGHRLAFQDATVEQARNAHDLMKDFEDEVIGYRRNAEIGALLERAMADLAPAERASMGDTARALWRALATAGIVEERELVAFERWLAAATAFVRAA
ncbi:MAG TPA: STELLO glycosyltransferase family protein [Anaeromyxobacter sp.]